MIKFLKSLFKAKVQPKPVAVVADVDFFGMERQKVEVKRKPLVKKASVVAKNTTKRKAVKK